MIVLSRRRYCRKHGHRWQHRTVVESMCLASRATCTFCGYKTWRFWEESHA